MTIKPFLILITVVIGWILVPPTVFYIGHLISMATAKRLGKNVKPFPAFVIKKWYASYTFIGFAFGWSTVFLFYPLCKAIGYSFTDKSLSPIAGAHWVGFTNYSTILTDSEWWKSIAVTAIYIAGTLPYSVFLSLFIASLIVGLSTRWQTFFKLALYLPGVTSMAVGAAITKWLYYPGDGAINIVLRKLGLISQNMNWFGDPKLALPTLIVMTWLGVNGLGVLIYCAALGGIPKDYYEAADLDGATPSQKFRHITWPLVKPSTVYVLITGLIGGFQIFAPAMLITGGGPQNTTNFVNYTIYRTFYYDNDFGKSCAMSVVLMVIIIIISIINYKAVATDVEY
jgi:multiple sugar transport system permease protein